jgi:hypothetical protein
MIIFIAYLLNGVYIASFWKVCNMFAERKISPFGILPWILLLVPIVNTLYWLIFGTDWDLKINENLKRLFGKLPEKEKEDK